LYFRCSGCTRALGRPLASVLAALFLVLGLLGSCVHWQRDRHSYFGSLMFTMTLVLIYYLNRYGAAGAGLTAWRARYATETASIS
jgi:hypothetical protein